MQSIENTKLTVDLAYSSNSEFEKDDNLSKFLLNARKSNIKVQIPDDCKAVGKSKDSVQKCFQSGLHSESLSLNQPKPRLVLSSININSSNGNLANSFEKTSSIEKYNVCAFPFIPQSNSAAYCPRILKISHINGVFDPKLFHQFCKTCGDIMISEIYDTTGYVVYFDSTHSKVAYKEIYKSLLNYHPGVTVGYYSSFDQVSLNIR